MQEIDNILIYAPVALIIAYWIYAAYKKTINRKKSFDSYYDKILSSEKYKVKGKYET